MATNTKPYREAFESAVEELEKAMTRREELDGERERLDRRIRSLREGVTGLGTLCGLTRQMIHKAHPELFPNVIDPDTGLTNAVREVLKSNDTFYYSAVGVRDKLRAQGFPIDNYKNELATLHTILKRLKRAAQVMEGSREGKTVYRWKSGVAVPVQRRTSK